MKEKTNNNLKNSESCNLSEQTKKGNDDLFKG